MRALAAACAPRPPSSASCPSPPPPLLAPKVSLSATAACSTFFARSTGGTSTGGPLPSIGARRLPCRPALYPARRSLPTSRFSLHCIPFLQPTRWPRNAGGVRSNGTSAAPASPPTSLRRHHAPPALHHRTGCYVRTGNGSCGCPAKVHGRARRTLTSPLLHGSPQRRLHALLCTTRSISHSCRMRPAYWQCQPA